MALDYLEEAEIYIEQAKLAFDRERFNTVMRRSQDCVEYCLKAALRAIGIEYPKEHEISDILVENSGRFPQWFQNEIHFLSECSMELTSKRGLATYGDERKKIPAKKIFQKKDAEDALQKSGTVLEICRKLLKGTF